MSSTTEEDKKKSIGEGSPTKSTAKKKATVDMTFSDSDDGSTSLQEKKAAEDLANRKRKQNAEFENKLNHIVSNPRLWHATDNRYLRQFCNTIENNHDTYPYIIGDINYVPTNTEEQHQPQLTTNYIRSIAEYRDTSFAQYPVLYVISRTTEYEDQSFSGFSNREPPPVKFTHLNVMDGDGNTMYARLSTQISDQGKQLKREGGNIIRLDIYTELTHRLNQSTSKMPCVFIHKYSSIGFRNAPPVATVYDPISCANHLPVNDRPKKSTNSDTSDDPVDCCPTDRYCSMHGVSFIVCICDCIKVEDLDLPSIKEDCYFATDKMEDMPNNHKRNMIYWWYATNVYSICGKKKRKELPKCLVHRVRQHYPSDEYCGYEHACDMHNN